MSSGRTTNVAGVVSLLGAFLAAALIMGLLSAGLFVPVVGAAGAAAQLGVDLFDSLPSEFTSSPLSEQSVILNADGSKLATPFDENRVIVTLADIAPIMRSAQVTIEDHRFYEHGGVDLQGVLRAFVSNQASGGVTGGGSTLTQQYVKITLQENALRAGNTTGAKQATAQSYARKIQELKYAIQLEKTLTKDQILEGYLNLVYYGDRAYGVEAASEHFFGHSAKTLNLAESALLAGLTQNPGTTDPINYPDKALARRNVVLDRMHDLAVINDADWQAARAVPLADMMHPKAAMNSCQSSPYPYFCDYVIAWLKIDPSLDGVLGKSEAERVQAIYRGGLTIQTTLDPRIQNLAQQQLTARVPIGNMPAKLGAASAVMDVKTGAVKAIVQNTNYNVKGTDKDVDTTVNYAVDTKYGGSLGFGFGSTEKAFTLVTALEHGYPTTASVMIKGASPSRGALFTGKDIPGDCGLGGSTWKVPNDMTVPDGPMTLVEATAHSINTAFVALAAKVGVCNVQQTEFRLGLHQSSGKIMQPFPSAIILGTDSVSPMTVANAYGTIANDGKYCPPTPILSVTKDGKPLGYPALGSLCEQRVEPDVAHGVTSILTNVMRGSGTGAGSALAGGRPSAGKTGTTDRNNETWFVGYTPELVTAVWVGTPNDDRNRQVLDGVSINGHYIGTVFGKTLAAPTWKAIMDGALDGTPNTPFPSASTKVTQGEQIDIPSVARRSVGDATALLDQAGFAPYVKQVYSNYKPGTVVGTSPSGTATRGAAVALLVSQGPAPAPTTAPPGPTPGAPPPSG
jgi:membrane peptidoglycan carboxypeptidase